VTNNRIRAFGSMTVDIYFNTSVLVYLLINSFKEIIIDQAHVICHQAVNKQNKHHQGYLSKLYTETPLIAATIFILFHGCLHSVILIILIILYDSYMTTCI